MKSFRSVLQTAPSSSSDPMTAASPLTVPRLSFSDLNEHFADVDPVPQDDGPELVCKIDYPPNFRKVFDLFRAVLQTNELSTRVLGLTGLCLEQNPANYTVWHVRRQCLFEWSSSQLKQQTTSSTDNDDNDVLSATVSTTVPPPPILRWLPAELEFTASLAGSNPKNYQVWYHRRSLLQALVPLVHPEDNSSLLWLYHAPEIAYIDSVLQQDGKNYHAWSHRQWLVLTLAEQKKESTSNTQNHRVQELWNEELQATHRLIVQDLRNNSAWNHRWFVLHRGQQPQQQQKQQQTQSAAHTNNTTHPLISPPDWEAEIDYCLEQVARDVYNESSCRFLLALAKFLWKQPSSPDASLVESHILPAIHLATDETADAAPIWSARADLHALVNPTDEVIGECWDHLETIDPIRRKYWQWRKTSTMMTNITTATTSASGDAMETTSDTRIVGLPNTAGTACHVLSPILLLFYSIESLREILVYLGQRLPRDDGNNALVHELATLFQSLDHSCRGEVADNDDDDIHLGRLYQALLSDLGIEARHLGDATTAISKIIAFLRKPKDQEDNEVEVMLSKFTEAVLGTGRVSTKIRGVSMELGKQRIKQLKVKPMAVPMTLQSSSSNDESQSFQECLDSYLAPKRVEGYEWTGNFTEEDAKGDDDLAVENAGGDSNASQFVAIKSIHLESLPNWWLIYLDRFTFQDGKTTASAQQIDIPLAFEQGTVVGGTPSAFVLKGAVLYAEAVSDVEEDEENGHYATLVSGGNENASSWSLINDDTVVKVSEGEALDLLRGADFLRDGEETLNMRAVLLLYEESNAMEKVQSILKESKARLDRYFENGDGDRESMDES